MRLPKETQTAACNRNSYAAGNDESKRIDVDTSSDCYEFSFEEQKKIMRRVDIRLLATVGLLYCFSVIDRSNLPSAAVAGMLEDLDMTGNRYSIVSLVFFTTYITFQPISVILSRTLGPRTYFTGITMLCGGIVLVMGFLTNWSQMVALRVILGALDSGFFPSCVYLLSTWYTRYEVGKRFSVFYMIVCFASAFAGILAFGLTRLNGAANLKGWSWIFVIEGIVTCIIGIVGYFLLVGFPDAQKQTWKFLSEKETAWVISRVQNDRGDAKLPAFGIKKFLRGGGDVKVWALAVIYFNNALINFSLSFFLPIILKDNMGFSTGKAQILTAPPYVFSAIIMYSTGWLGDRCMLRGPIIIGNMVLSIVGICLMGFHEDIAVRYFGVFLLTAGAVSNTPATMAYQANNIRGQWKRAFCSAFVVGISGIGGIAGSLVFRQDKPRYLPGLGACLGSAVFNIIVVICLSLYFYFWNSKASRGEVELEESDVSGP
ncbi:major facilitator superfamily domain-containing protein [Colletotrichum navitas]|uniref:Major facilitator superfamily domain-containing protein n=1 Tax=Colletotrichum navitas TaxID=681940 RepID=A0AAD8PV91_9PEZI|nr:major facilitator superfamily domain-containing protein [Colletotrichum navitas]KAK1585281.1 major facilitator superfamily domain-containing protein [Colletotrichum navitas]